MLLYDLRPPLFVNLERKTRSQSNGHAVGGHRLALVLVFAAVAATPMPKSPSGMLGEQSVASSASGALDRFRQCSPPPLLPTSPFLPCPSLTLLTRERMTVLASPFLLLTPSPELPEQHLFAFSPFLLFRLSRTTLACFLSLHHFLVSRECLFPQRIQWRAHQ